MVLSIAKAQVDDPVCPDLGYRGNPSGFEGLPESAGES